jgi:hypothetical protein
MGYNTALWNRFESFVVNNLSMVFSALANAADIFPSHEFSFTLAVKGETMKASLSSPLLSEGTAEIHHRRGGESAERRQEKNDFISPPFTFCVSVVIFILQCRLQ